MNEDLWSLVLARLPVSSFDSMYKVNRNFSKLVRKYERKTFTDEYKKCHKDRKNYMVIVSFKDSKHWEGFFINVTLEDKLWFKQWILLKFGQGISNFIIYECDPSEYTKKSDYITFPHVDVDNNDVIKGSLKHFTLPYADGGVFVRRYDINCFKWANGTVHNMPAYNIIEFKTLSIFKAIRQCNFNYILPDFDTLIDYDKLMKFDEECWKMGQDRINTECDECTVGGEISNYPYLKQKWFEIERIEKVKAKTSYYCGTHEFFDKKRTDKIFLRWSNMRGMYFAIHQNRDGDDFISVIENTMERTYILISCIGGHPTISYPGYSFTLSDGSTDSPEGINIGNILPPQKKLKYDGESDKIIEEDKGNVETTPKEIIKIVFDWANKIISRYRASSDSSDSSYSSDSSVFGDSESN